VADLLGLVSVLGLVVDIGRSGISADSRDGRMYQFRVLSRHPRFRGEIASIGRICWGSTPMLPPLIRRSGMKPEVESCLLYK